MNPYGETYVISHDDYYSEDDSSYVSKNDSLLDESLSESLSDDEEFELSGDSPVSFEKKVQIRSQNTVPNTVPYRTLPVIIV